MNAFDKAVLWLMIRFLDAAARCYSEDGEHLQAWRAYRICDLLSQMRGAMRVPFFSNDQTERFAKLSLEAGKKVQHQ